MRSPACCWQGCGVLGSGWTGPGRTGSGRRHGPGTDEIRPCRHEPGARGMRANEPGQPRTARHCGHKIAAGSPLVENAKPTRSRHFNARSAFQSGVCIPARSRHSRTKPAFPSEAGTPVRSLQPKANPPRTKPEVQSAGGIPNGHRHAGSTSEVRIKAGIPKPRRRSMPAFLNEAVLQDGARMQAMGARVGFVLWWQRIGEGVTAMTPSPRNDVTDG